MAFTVQYTIGGGVPNYTVTLSGSILPPNVHTTDGTFSFVNVESGNYTIIAEDQNACIFEVPVNVS